MRSLILAILPALFVTAAAAQSTQSAHEAILKNFKPSDCPAVVWAQGNDGAILAFCSNREKFWIMRLPSNDMPIVMRCSGAKQLGLDVPGC